MKQNAIQMTGVLGTALLAVLVVGAVPAQAGIAQVTTRKALAGNDLLNWIQLANTGVLTAPVTVTTNGGLTATLSDTGVMSVETQGEPGQAWDGNFALGAPIVSTGQFGAAGPITITFATPVSAVGAQMNYNVTGNTKASPFPFNVTMTLYNSAGQLLGTFTAQGEQYSYPDNSAAFIGAVDSQAEISQVVFSTTTTGGPFPGSFAINNVSIDAPRHCTY